MIDKKDFLKKLDEMHPFVSDTPIVSNGCGYFVLDIGDITNIEADVLVCPVNEGYTNGGGVAAAIFRAAGDALLEDYRRCDKNKPCLLIPLGEDHIGHLKAKAVCFVPIPAHTSSDNLHMGIDGCFEDTFQKLLSAYAVVYAKINECGMFDTCATVVFPLLGSGAAGYQAQLSAEAALTSFEHYNIAGYKKRISVCLVANSEKHLKAMEDARRFMLFKGLMRQIIAEIPDKTE